MPPSEPQKDRFRKRLIELDPPEEVLAKYDELIGLATDHQTEDSLEDLLLDACRASNWTTPWEPKGVHLTFRAKKLKPSHPEYKADIGGENNPAEEQC